METEMNEAEKSIIIARAQEINTMLEDMTRSLISSNPSLESLALIGMRTRGEFIARRLQILVKKFSDIELPMGVLDVSFYRDDTRAKLKQPLVQSTEIRFNINERPLVLVDDVLFTGRSVRAAMDELMDFGRPSRIQLAVLIDRGCRELPIQSDIYGKKITSEICDKVKVCLEEYDKIDEITLIKGS
ncbi:MAG TPA: bifunctional pyr operon transcriptional regulator/uracil phosphoribosyltransferase PyrR [bacterium]|nr:bifunctional pyr operon transcriptional regulator/uracil phosphoribosyltransferase PyrR [bacterium]HNB56700.1 bifunctional pyr operon transcriptional regulator/uracil phosphoribosyltransferase PyrR [bacterium]HNE83343.1 bifunctional pyr operon transcriptional regulator/uracil phosphoribosyltransferase PyrR [bacterium]